MTVETLSKIFLLIESTDKSDTITSSNSAEGVREIILIL